MKFTDLERGMKVRVVGGTLEGMVGFVDQDVRVNRQEGQGFTSQSFGKVRIVFPNASHADVMPRWLEPA